MSTVLQSLNAALHQAMQADENVVLLGEDLLDPYGGAFKVTRGLSSSFTDRVWNSPISEAGIVGLGAGMALRGLRPVVEIMFGDFITLAADQLVNHIAKFRWMYNDQVRVPIVIRTPMGGRRGYGPTHSQTLEKLFLGVPGMKVVAPCDLQIASKKSTNGQINAGNLLNIAIFDDEPVLFIENKLLYLSKLQTPEMLPDFEIRITPQSTQYPTFHLSIQGAPPPSLTITAYGHMAGLARQAALKLAYEHEIFSEIVAPTQLSPFDEILDPILDSVRSTGRLLTVEEGAFSLGWGAEIVARNAETQGSQLHAAQRVAAVETPIPASSVLEETTLPGVAEIVAAARMMV
jgi:acetoin:2,6-dichlorophenolindophenol oxidoreductase subunit beta